MPVTTDGQQLVYPSDTEAGVDNRRLTAEVIYDQEILTFQDAVESILDAFDVPRDDRNHRLAIRAVLKAHKMFPTLHSWSYYRRPLVINTVAAYSTGTLAFDFTGGTYERLITLSGTGASFPTWAGFGVIRIDSVDYPVMQRVDSTRITLDSRRCPSADLAAGTAYTLYRDRYALPLDFRRHDRIFEAGTNRELCIADAGSAAANTLLAGGTSSPAVACIIEDENFQGGLALMISPAVNSATKLQFLYERKMRPLLTEKYETGTITIVADSATITGSGTAWTERMIGTLIRVSPNSSPPTPVAGSIAATEPNVASYTRMVLGVSSATALLVDETLGESASGRAYTLSDPIDVTDLMIDAFLRMAELEYAKLSGREDVAERNAYFIGALEIARNAMRSSSVIQTGTLTGDEGYSYMGSVNVTST